MKRHCAGFTLIEVIASLVIVGILGAIAGMGIVTGMRGYLQAKENGHLAQKAQIALTRINRELIGLTDVIARNDGADPWVIFENRCPLARRGIAKVGSTVRLYNLSAGSTDLSGVTGDTLIDQIDSFSIKYYEGANPNWVIGDDIDLLSSVEVNFVLRRKEGRKGEAGTVLFSTIVNPRNTANFGGAPTTTEPVTAKQYQCFISTATSGSLSLNFLLQKWPFTAIILAVIGIIPAAAGLSHRSDDKIDSSTVIDVRNERGNVLVALVVILLLFAALGAGMVSLIGTSSTSQVTGDTAARAYYIAESGFRYAASRYLNTTDTNNRYRSQDEKNQTLEDLHDDLFTLAGDDGQFRLKLFPYFLTANGNASVGSSVLSTKFSGGQPDGFTLPSSGANARIKIGDVVYSYNSYNDSTGQLNLSSPLAEPVYDNAVVKLVGFPAGSATVTRDGDLTLADGSFFPKIQGRIKIYGVAYSYNCRDGNILQAITMAQDPEESFSISLDASTEVVQEPYVQVRSIGIVGQGDLSANREVVYNVPIPDQSSEAIIFRDDFNDLSNWSSPTYGSFAIENREGENVLAVTDVEPGFGVEKAGLIAFNWATDKVVNFAYSHRLAGYYLSYDNQVKIGFDSTPLPEQYDAGLAFRLDENENFYGLSFLRGCSSCDPAGRIPDEIVPENDVNLIVLWQQTGNGTSRKWLAYSEVGLPYLFSDGAESEPPPGKWISENDHAGDPLWTRDHNFAHSPGRYSWKSGSIEDNNYEDPPAGETWNDYLISEAIDFSQVEAAYLTFWTRYRMAACEDWGFVEISEDNGSNWDMLNDRLPLECGGVEPNDSSYAGYTGNSDALPDEEDGWVKKTIDISSYVGNSSVRIRFRFERNCCATGNGWWVDDIRIIQDLQDFPLDRSTLLVRIYEGALVEFNSGGTTPIEQGDFVTQSNGAIGRVIIPPLLTSGSWAGGNAAGMLLLNNTSLMNDFTLGSLNKGAINVATVTAPPSRRNLIQAYYGADSGVDPPPTSPAPDGLYPYDQERLRNTFGTANWPPDPDNPPTGFDDYYTLVQWNDAVQEVDRLADNNGKYTIISSNQTELFTPTDAYFPFTRPEIGLQVAGQGGADVYFKDYAVKLGYAAQKASIPIQQ
jgi:prepilin-type N-terminal cleavage/methylation domain-containing protein